MARTLKVWVDRDTCIGYALCVDSAPETFELDDDGKSHAVASVVPESDEVGEAVRGCPVDAIHAEDAASGEELYRGPL